MATRDRPLTCDCGQCRTCLHRECVRKIRKFNLRFTTLSSLEGHAEVLVFSGFESSWVQLEEALFRRFGKPRRTVNQELADHRQSERMKVLCDGKMPDSLSRGQLRKKNARNYQQLS